VQNLSRVPRGSAREVLDLQTARENGRDHDRIGVGVAKGIGVSSFPAP
jgi:hypothetical protein